ENAALKAGLKASRKRASKSERDQLEAENRKLREQLAKDSTNSSKPPGTDGLKKTVKNLRPKTGRKPGGQPGHKGSTLEMSGHPDFVERHPAPGVCPCGHPLHDVVPTGTQARQVFDIPPIALQVTEHLVELKVCPHCHQVSMGAFPVGVSAPVQYGPMVKAFAAYFHGYQLLPALRTAEAFADLCNAPLSTGFLCKSAERLFDTLAAPTEEIVKELKSSEVLQCDSTGVRINGKTYRLHVFTTPRATYYYVHKGNGEEAVRAADILPDFHGVVVHDHALVYYLFGDETSQDEGYNMQQVPRPEQACFLKAASAMGVFSGICGVMFQGLKGLPSIFSITPSRS
ncbi:MAG: hypothetical protein EOM10_17980, partial [Opitutae bacterium]|nr:hypothetical protein [Opitutae bacterium]